MNEPLVPHVSVCICTFKRPQLLRHLLDELCKQQTDGKFTISVVVADNDPEGSAKRTVADFSSSSGSRVTYCLETQRNIALARNKALENAEGEFVAFIDDDEFPSPDWLLRLIQTCQTYTVAGVLGPVIPCFESEPPKWLIKGKFFDRPRFTTGFALSWEQARTGNVLFRREILNSLDVPFRSQFDTAGEDIDFFRRLMEKQYLFVWCDEAIAHEFVPAFRCTRKYLLRRALLRGSNFHKHPTNKLKNALKSLIAVPCYVVILPIVAVFGQHLFLEYLVKLLDHSSRLLAYLGLSLVTQRQT